MPLITSLLTENRISQLTQFQETAQQQNTVVDGVQTSSINELQVVVNSIGDDITAINESLDLKANISDVYSITGANNAFQTSDYSYSKVETDTFLNNKANVANTYSNTQINSLLLDKANITNTYSKTEIDGTIANYTTTSDMNDLLDAKIDISTIGVAYGICPLDAGNKVDVSFLPSNFMQYIGVYNASSNTPSLSNGVGSVGDVYIVSVAGSRDFGSGSISFAVSDWVIYNGSIWQKSDANDDVVSVFGRIGVITAQESDYSSFFYTKSIADSKYQLISDMSSYLTTATASSTYQPLSGMSSYLTTATASSTYQPISSMSSYLTTANATSTYLTQSNATSTYGRLASTNTWTGTNYLNGVSQFEFLTEGAASTFNFLNRGSTDNTAVGIRLIPRPTASNGSATMRCRYVSTNVEELRFSVAHPSSTFEVTSCVVLNTAGVITQDYSGVCNFSSVPTCPVSATTSTHLVNKAYADGLLTPYLLSATASSTYLTQSNATSTYQPIASMSSYLTTANASSTYLTQSNATSTYQPISDMSSYLTTTNATSTYQPLSGMSSYLTTSNATSTYQPIASMSSYLTTANASSTYQTISGMSSYGSLSGTNTWTGTNYLNGVSQFEFLTDGAASTFNFLNRGSSANSAVGIRLIARPTSAFGSGTLRCRYVSATVQELRLSVAHPGTTTELVSCAILNTNGVITQDYTGVCNFSSVPTCPVAPSSGNNLVNKTYADGLLTPYLLSATASSTYLTQSNATSTYQTIGDMASYLTTANASSTYQTISGMSSYLTTANASSTYQTISGMSSYLTTANASSTYQTISGMSSYGALSSANTWAGTNTFNGTLNFNGTVNNLGFTQFQQNTAGGPSYWNFLNRSDTANTACSIRLIPRVTSTQGSLQIRCKNISSTVQEFNTSMAHPTTTSEVNICTVLNTSGTITQTFNGACTFNTTPSCSVDPTTSTHLVNKTYVDSAISSYAPLFMAPRINCVSYNLGNMNLPISSITSQYYEYSVNYTNNTSNQWSNVVYPSKTLINKNNIHYSSSGSVNKVLVNYMAFEIINTSDVSPDGQNFSSIGSGVSDLLGDAVTRFTGNATYYNNGTMNSSNSFIFNTRLNSNNFYYTDTTALVAVGSSYTWPTARVVIVCWYYCVNSVLYFGVSYINQSTNAVIKSYELNVTATSGYSTAMSAFANYVPMIILNSNASINRLRLYHTLPSGILGALPSALQHIATSYFDWNNSTNVMSN
jgi:hypothetical protein